MVVTSAVWLTKNLKFVSISPQEDYKMPSQETKVMCCKKCGAPFTNVDPKYLEQQANSRYKYTGTVVLRCDYCAQLNVETFVRPGEEVIVKVEYSATVHGSGASAVGDHAVAVGERGVYIGGSVGGAPDFDPEAKVLELRARRLSDDQIKEVVTDAAIEAAEAGMKKSELKTKLWSCGITFTNAEIEQIVAHCGKGGGNSIITGDNNKVIRW